MWSITISVYFVKEKFYPKNVRFSKKFDYLYIFETKYHKSLVFEDNNMYSTTPSEIQRA